MPAMDPCGLAIRDQGRTRSSSRSLGNRRTARQTSKNPSQNGNVDRTALRLEFLLARQKLITCPEKGKSCLVRQVLQRKHLRKVKNCWAVRDDPRQKRRLRQRRRRRRNTRAPAAQLATLYCRG